VSIRKIRPAPDVAWLDVACLGLDSAEGWRFVLALAVVKAADVAAGLLSGDFLRGLNPLSVAAEKPPEADPERRN
jgi:hypothetical protein